MTEDEFRAAYEAHIAGQSGLLQPRRENLLQRLWRAASPRAMLSLLQVSALAVGIYGGMEANLYLEIGGFAYAIWMAIPVRL